MSLDGQHELLLIVEAASAAMRRVYARAPGLVVVNVPGAVPADDVALALAEDGLSRVVWLDVLRSVPAGLPLCIDGAMEEAADWVTAFERLPSGGMVSLDCLPDASACRHDRLQLADGLLALAPPDFRPLQWPPPAPRYNNAPTPDGWGLLS